MKPLILDLTGFQSTSFYSKPSAKALDLKEVSPGKSTIHLTASATGSIGVDLDMASWLPMASEVYNISRNIRDYVLVPIPAMITGIPNTNGDSATTSHMLRFDPSHGMPSYKTFKGKPTHSEHANKDFTLAKGIIFDSFIQPLPQFKGDHARLTLLLGFDRTRDPELANAILSNRINTYSIGMVYDSYKCSICKHIVEKETMTLCSHTRPKQPTYMHPNGVLSYRECRNIVGFECSSVGDPAFVSAVHNPKQIIDVANFR
jgi:hypothetical protein